MSLFMVGSALAAERFFLSALLAGGTLTVFIVGVAIAVHGVVLLSEKSVLSFGVGSVLLGDARKKSSKDSRANEKLCEGQPDGGVASETELRFLYCVVQGE